MSETEPAVSPFSYLKDPSVTFVSNNIIPLYGEYELIGYSIPSVEVCLWYPTFDCEWDWYGWRDWALSVKCTSDWTNWCCCWGTPEIVIVPDLTFTMEGNIPIIIETVVEGYQMPLTTPIEPIYTTYVYIDPFTLYLLVEGTGFALHCLEERYQLGTDDEFTFETEVILPSWEYGMTVGAYRYEAKIWLDLEFDLYPSGFATYVDIPVKFSLRVEDSVTGSKIVDYTFSFDTKIV